MLKIISWNINGRTGNNNEQLGCLLEEDPDIICFQEVRKNALKNFTPLLIEHGYEIAESVRTANQQQRVKGLLTGSKLPFSNKEKVARYVPHPESVLYTSVVTESGDVDIYNTHMPNGSSNGWKKIETFEGLYEKLAVETKRLRVLCGDFNSPQAEFPPGETITWGHR